MTEKPKIVHLKQDVDPAFVRLCGLAWETGQETDQSTLTATCGDLAVTITVSRIEPDET